MQNLQRIIQGRLDTRGCENRPYFKIYTCIKILQVNSFIENTYILSTTSFLKYSVYSRRIFPYLSLRYSIVMKTINQRLRTARYCRKEIYSKNHFRIKQYSDNHFNIKSFFYDPHPSLFSSILIDYTLQKLLQYPNKIKSTL